MPNEIYQTEEGKPISVVQVDKYYVVIGVEANNENAYRDEKITFSHKVAKHQILTGQGFDYGHAFFYVVKNDEVFCFFSFGPSAGKKLGNNALGNASTCQYPITEVAQLFYIEIVAEIADLIKKDVSQLYKESNNFIYNKESGEWESIKSNDKKYRVLSNETCAKEAEHILKKHLNERVPSGLGYVKWKKISKKEVNPYAWHENLVSSGLKKYTFPEYPKIGKGVDLLVAFNKKTSNGEIEKIYTYYLRTEHANNLYSEPMDPIFDKDDTDEWRLLEGDLDPLKEYGYI